MPCRSDYMEPTGEERAQTKALREEFQALGDAACADADVLREYALGNVAAERILGRVNKDYGDKYNKLVLRNRDLYIKVSESVIGDVLVLVLDYHEADRLAHDKAAGKPLADDELDNAEVVQIEHREADLRRLMKTFGETGDRERLRKVLDADNTKPLAPQLGFDPDEF